LIDRRWRRIAFFGFPNWCNSCRLLVMEKARGAEAWSSSAAIVARPREIGLSSWLEGDD